MIGHGGEHRESQIWISNPVVIESSAGKSKKCDT